MPTSTWLNAAARVAMMVLSGAVWLAASGCGNSELGSIKVPAELRREAKAGYGPGATRPGTGSLRPGQFRPAPAPKTRPSRR
jgi:hypothetical protein